jgi:hypothetical protein
MPFSTLPALVIASSAFALIALIIQITRTLSFGRGPYFAKANGNPVRGVVYAFGRGMMPWEKESTGKHLPTFFAGILYHTAIFSAILYLIAVLFEMNIPSAVIPVLRIVLLGGLLCGLTLLFKRLLFPYMRGISCLDDFLANSMVNLFLAASIIVTLAVQLKSLFFIFATILFVYVPMGKIRHCFFFFYSRILFGAYFGRRGVFPHPSREI